MRQLLLCFAISLPLLILQSSAEAANIAYEGFDYASGSNLLGANGGSGFPSGWSPGGFNASISNNFDIAADSLTFGSLLTSGNRAITDSQNSISGISRNLTMPGATGSSQFVSFLVRPEGVLGNGVFNGFLGLTFERADTELFAGKPGGGNLNDFVLENRGGTNQVTSGETVEIDETTFIVLRMDFLDGSDAVSMYVNPTPGGPEPAAGIVKADIDLVGMTGITMYSSGAYSLDEIRVGDSYAAVTPIPEPSCHHSLIFGVAVLALWTRRASR